MSSSSVEEARKSGQLAIEFLPACEDFIKVPVNFHLRSYYRRGSNFWQS